MRRGSGRMAGLVGRLRISNGGQVHKILPQLLLVPGVVERAYPSSTRMSTTYLAQLSSLPAFWQSTIALII